MTVKRIPSFFVCLLAAALLVGCSGADNVVFKVFTGERPGEQGSIPDAVATGPLASPPPGLGRTRFRKKPVRKKPAAAMGAAETRLRAGHASLINRIFAHDDELERLRRSVVLHYVAYRKAVRGFGLSKRKSLPPNDDRYRANMAEARRRLARVNGDLLKLNIIAVKVNADVAQAGRLLGQARKAKAAGQAPPTLAREIGATVATTRRMLAEIHFDISRQAIYTNSQSRGLEQLAKVVAAGGAPVAGTTGAGARNKPAGGVASAVPAKRPRSTRPLVRIPFAASKVAYEAPLYEALKAALAKRPGLQFEIVGVARTAARRGAALGNAQQVMFAMAEMGVPPDRVTLGTAIDPKVTADEVHLYVK